MEIPVNKGTVFKPRGEAPSHLKKSDQVATEVKRWIVDQSLEPGDRLPIEQDMAPWFGCGKGTVREALKSLEVQGLVTMRTGPNGGPILKESSYARAAEQLRTYLNFKQLEINEIYAMRQIIEPEMAVTVVDVVDDELLVALRASASDCQHMRDGGGKGVRQRELEFHVILAQRCPNPLLSFQSLFIGDLLRGFIHFENSASEKFFKFTEDNCDYHVQLISAFTARNHKDVRRVMNKHMESSKNRTLELCGKISDSLLLLPGDRTS